MRRAEGAVSKRETWKVGTTHDSIGDLVTNLVCKRLALCSARGSARRTGVTLADRLGSEQEVAGLKRSANSVTVGHF